VLLLWSPASVKSRFVIGEADAAERLGKLVTIRVPGLGDDRMPLGYGGLRCESLFQRDHILQSLAALGAIAEASL
jgi:hypothetical protein